MEEKNNSNITIAEFKIWLAGFLQGKAGQLPNEHDWTIINEMLEQVNDSSNIKDTVPCIPKILLNPYVPEQQKYPPYPYDIWYCDYSTPPNYTYTPYTTSTTSSGTGN